jgi:EamA domain-containing membrane protein RarD
MTVIFYTLMGMLAYTLGEYFAKKYAMKPTAAIYWASVLAYLATTFAWMPVILKTNTLAVTSTLWNIGYFVTSIALGVVLFHEKLSPLQIVGIVFAGIAVVLLSIESA